MTSEKKFDLQLHEIDRQLIKWGTYGKRGDDPLKVKYLRDLSTQHIMAIRLTQHQISDKLKQHFADEIHYRELFPEANIQNDNT